MKKALPIAKKKTEIQELSEFVRDHMVTKDYLDAKLEPIYEQLKNHTMSLSEIREEVRDIRRTLEDLERKIGNLKGYQNDIDFLYKRLGLIEEHIGMKSAAKK